MRWPIAAVLAAALWAAAAAGTFVPLDRGGRVVWVFAWAGGPATAAAAALAAAAVAALAAAVGRLARRLAPAGAPALAGGAWLAPLAGLAAIVLGLLPAVPGVGAAAAPAAFFFFDLRWWWAAALTGWALLRADAAAGHPVRARLAAAGARSPAARLLALDALIFAALTAWAVATLPHLRWSAAVHGDEPKYLRYAELWYQGAGLDITAKARLSDLPADASSAVWRNVPLAARAAADDAAQLARDVAAFVRDPTGFRWNRARGEGGFVEGWRGGVYQLHQPGLAALLFPGYYIDRHLLARGSGYQDELPDTLAATGTVMLAIYGLAGVALFRLLRRALGADGPALGWAALAMIALPAGPFAFQFYPEAPAALVVIASVSYALYHAGRASPRLAAGAGLLAGSLLWLHPRFLLVSAVLAAFGVRQSARAARPAFATGWIVALAGVSAWAYHVTGSPLPTALYDASTGEGGMDWRGMPVTLLGYAFHRLWGLVPHAPLLLLVPAGLLLLGRSSRSAAWLLAAAALALAIPAAGHSLSAAGGTPGRFVAAVLPLAAWPIALAVRRWRGSAGATTLAAVGVALAIEAAAAYNLSHVKGAGPLRHEGLAGWRPNLMFPLVEGDPALTSAEAWLLVAEGIAVTLAAVWLGVRRARPSTTPAWRRRVAPAATIGLVVAAAVGASALQGTWTADRYRLRAAPAFDRAARALLARDFCRVCFSSDARQIDWTWLRQAPVAAAGVDVRVDGRAVAVRVSLRTGAGEPALGRVRVDFGDGAASPWTGVRGEGGVRHTYARAGEYEVVTWLELEDGTRRGDRRRVTAAR